MRASRTQTAEPNDGARCRLYKAQHIVLCCECHRHISCTFYYFQCDVAHAYTHTQKCAHLYNIVAMSNGLWKQRRISIISLTMAHNDGTLWTTRNDTDTQRFQLCVLGKTCFEFDIFRFDCMKNRVVPVAPPARLPVTLIPCAANGFQSV